MDQNGKQNENQRYVTSIKLHYHSHVANADNVTHVTQRNKQPAVVNKSLHVTGDQNQRNNERGVAAERNQDSVTLSKNQCYMTQSNNWSDVVQKKNYSHEIQRDVGGHVCLDQGMAKPHLTKLKDEKRVLPKMNQFKHLRASTQTDGQHSGLQDKNRHHVTSDSTETSQPAPRGQYGIDAYRTLWHVYVADPRSVFPQENHPINSSVRDSARSHDTSANMVIAIERVEETVAVVPRPSFQQKSVYTQLHISDHRRHREEVHFRPVLHPVRYSDTAFLYINNTRKRFLSRTFYEPRVRPRSISETTFTHPKSPVEHYVSYLDHYVDEDRKLFKTYIELKLKAKKFTSAQVLRSTNNNYINTSSITTDATHFLSTKQTSQNGVTPDSDSATSKYRGNRHFTENYDPGASQVYIPQRRERAINHQSLVNGQLILKFPNSQVDLNMNGLVDDYSEA